LANFQLAFSSLPAVEYKEYYAVVLIALFLLTRIFVKRKKGNYSGIMFPSRKAFQDLHLYLEKERSPADLSTALLKIENLSSTTLTIFLDKVRALSELNVALAMANTLSHDLQQKLSADNNEGIDVADVQNQVKSALVEVLKKLVGEEDISPLDIGLRDNESASTPTALPAVLDSLSLPDTAVASLRDEKLGELIETRDVAASVDNNVEQQVVATEKTEERKEKVPMSEDPHIVRAPVSTCTDTNVAAPLDTIDGLQKKSTMKEKTLAVEGISATEITSIQSEAETTLPLDTNDNAAPSSCVAPTSEDEHRLKIICTNGDMCYLPRGMNKYDGLPCSICKEWVHRVCAPHRFTKQDLLCTKCYFTQYDQHGPKKVSVTTTKDTQWLKIYRREQSLPSPAPPHGLLIFDPSNGAQVDQKRYRFNMDLYRIADEDIAIDQNAFTDRHRNLLEHYGIGPVETDQYATALPSSGPEPGVNQQSAVQELDSQNAMDIDSDTNVAAIIPAASLSHAEVGPHNIYYVAVAQIPLGKGGSSPNLPFSLVVLPDENYNIQAAIASKEDLYLMIPENMTEETMLDHIIWKESEKRLPYVHGSSTKVLSKTAKMSSENGTIDKHTLLVMLTSMPNILGKSHCDTVRHLLRRCSPLWQENITRIKEPNMPKRIRRTYYETVTNAVNNASDD
jgi:hypothetical protein